MTPKLNDGMKRNNSNDEEDIVVVDFIFVFDLLPKHPNNKRIAIGVVHGSGVKGGRYRDTLVVMCSD